MSIHVRYFASLKEQLNKSTDEIRFEKPQTVEEVWKQANPNITIPINTLAAVNMEYVELDASVKDNDEVAFFPPVTGG